MFAQAGRLRELGTGTTDTQPHGALAVGASNTIGNYLVGEQLGEFDAAYPALEPGMRVANGLHCARCSSRSRWCGNACVGAGDIERLRGVLPRRRNAGGAPDGFL